MKRLPYLVIGVLLCLPMRRCGRETVRTERFIDTVIVRDTIRDTMPIPKHVYITRVDTVFLKAPAPGSGTDTSALPENKDLLPGPHPRAAADTVPREVIVPIERKEYRTDDYRAIIEGYRPSLVSMEVYPETRYVTRTEVNTVKKKPRLGLGIQAGYGIGPHGPAPYVGVGVQYNLVSF